MNGFDTLEKKPAAASKRIEAAQPRRRGRSSTNTSSEALLSSTMDALSAHIAVLDHDGTIIAVNDAWRRFAENAGLQDPQHGVGSNYLKICERAARFSPEAASTVEALRDILSGRRREFRIEYACVGPTGTRWFQLRVTQPAEASPRRIVMAHEDITETKHAEQELARLSARLLQLQDAERRQIAGELHDTTAQNLLAITLNLARLQERLREAPGRVPRILAETLSLAEQSLQEIRTLSYLLHPPLLDEIGLASALRWYAKGFAERSGIEVGLAIDASLDRLPTDVETALFRVLQEALSNIHRHSGSRSATIALYREEGSVTLEIGDRGNGFLPARLTDRDDGAQSVGIGISGMRLRLRQLGGRLEIKSARSGTWVIATIPAPLAGSEQGSEKYERRPRGRPKSSR